MKHFLICALFFLWACSPKEYELVIEEPKLVAYAFFEKDRNLSVQVLQSSSPLEDGEDIISNATVQVYEDDLLLSAFAHQGNGVYQSDHKASANKEYRLVISAPGFSEVQSENILLPAFSDIAEVITKDSIEGEGNNRVRIFSQFTIRFQEPLTQSLYFTHSAYRIESDRPKSYSLQSEGSCFDQEGYAINGVRGFGLSCHSSIQEITLETNNQDVGIDLESRQRIEICQVNEMTHLFNSALNNTSLNNDNDLLIEAIQIPTNLQNGFGLLSVSHCKTFEIAY